MIQDCPILDCEARAPKVSEKTKGRDQLTAIGCKSCLLDSGWHETTDLAERNWNAIPAQTIKEYVASQR